MSALPEFAMPGECHPHYEWCAGSIREYIAANRQQIVVPNGPSASASIDDSIYPATTSANRYKILTVKTCGALAPATTKYRAHYEWAVAVDQAGRAVADRVVVLRFDPRESA